MKFKLLLILALIISLGSAESIAEDYDTIFLVGENAFIEFPGNDYTACNYSIYSQDRYSDEDYGLFGLVDSGTMVKGNESGWFFTPLVSFIGRPTVFLTPIYASYSAGSYIAEGYCSHNVTNVSDFISYSFYIGDPAPLMGEAVGIIGGMRTNLEKAGSLTSRFALPIFNALLSIPLIGPLLLLMDKWVPGFIWILNFMLSLWVFIPIYFMAWYTWICIKTYIKYKNRMYKALPYHFEMAIKSILAHLRFFISIVTFMVETVVNVTLRIFTILSNLIPLT